ncbi:putative capsular polysaccharide synthesis family protein [Marichromatium bheemlicum]|uniref:Capsular polysaccharide synthesis protein n=1 Tax=Marichromatium bheemlicum TaxID=365339 RepID=A0ABX1I733_9GAMM|nr:putative capsular polysaccharide synthesis family protein [Marichromatium bheemlicum]NKN33373.1 hypothetical protein [Marichromatium bheemlicum]
MKRSLQRARQHLYAWQTRHRNRRSLAALEAHLAGRDPALLVHQMGRAGSMTTVNTLRAAGLGMPVFHTHWLNPVNIRKRLDRFAGAPERRLPLNVRMARRIGQELQQHGPHHRPWHLVSVFREPVARNLSVYFLSIEDFIPDFFDRHARGALGDAEILETFLERFPHDQPVCWFDEEIRDTFGIDVYAQPFPIARGYQIIRQSDIAVLLIKVERLNDCYAAAFAEFLGVDVPRLEQTHVTEEDPAYSMYKDFIANVQLPTDYLDRLYDTRFARHFYGETEIARLRHQWGGGHA